MTGSGLDGLLVPRRMVNQRLWGSALLSVSDVLGAMAGMQAQEFHYALWSVAQRIGRAGGHPAAGGGVGEAAGRGVHRDADADGAVDKAAMDRAFADGQLLRTHVLRTTWHFAAPQDIRWMLRLTVPRLRTLTAYYDRQQQLDDGMFARANELLAQALSGGSHRTRGELSAILQQAGIAATGQRMGHIMMRAEFDEVVISGAPRGRQQTYAAFDERVPPDARYAREFDQDAGLAELARRFFTTRGPATVKDLATWASLTLTQARRGLAAVRPELSGAIIDGMQFYFADVQGDPTNVGVGSPRVDLVQGYDEIVMSYSESRGQLTAGPAVLPVPDRANYLHTILLDGIFAGRWRHQVGRDGALIETSLCRPLNRRATAALHDAVHRYGAYLGVPTTLASHSTSA